MKRRGALIGALIAALTAAALNGGAWAQANNQFSPDFKPENLYRGPADSAGDWQESDLKLPAYPKPENLIEYEVISVRSFRFFVDADSIAPGRDGIVRYTLVARSGSGTENVSFNGFRCRNGEQKVYATGRTSDKSWSTLRDSQWKVVEGKSIMRQNLALMRDFFCPGSVPIETRAEGIDALKRGAHPNAISNHSANR